MAHSQVRAVPCRANSHMPCCDRAKSSVKFLTADGRSRTAHLLLIAFVFIFKQTLNVETVSFDSVFHKYLTSYGWDQQRHANRSSCDKYILCFQYISFNDNPLRHVRVLLFTLMSNFNHHNSLSCLKAVLRKWRLLFETPFCCLTIGGLPHT